MSRTIKFRAWDKIKKEWKYFNFPKDFLKCWDIDALKKYPYENWCQSTGLLDKSGKEIYESYLVEWHPDYDKEKGGIAEVTYYKNEFMLSIERTAGYDFYGYEGAEFSWDELEVIGNVFEHPSLLSK